MHKSYKYRICPTKNQESLLKKSLELCRLVYNKTLELRKDAWENEKKSISLYDSHSYLGQWKKDNPELKNVHSQVLQNTQVRVDLAFKSFFRRVKSGEKPGYPRFKGYGRYDSFTYPQSGFKIANGFLSLSRIGAIKIILHRNMIGKIKTITITHNSSGKWYACFSVEFENAPLENSEGRIGIDVGLITFSTLSNGEKIENPKFFRRDERALAKAQRKVSKFEKGKAPLRFRQAVSLIHERIANRRRDFAHKESRKLINRFGIIAVEDLQVNRMVHNHCLAKSISDVAWTQFFDFLAYKAEWAGRQLVKVNPAYTSQTCSNCGHRQSLELSDRVYNCPCCGMQLGRDENAARNILALGLQNIGIQSVVAAISTVAE